MWFQKTELHWKENNQRDENANEYVPKHMDCRSRGVGSTSAGDARQCILDAEHLSG